LGGQILAYLVTLSQLHISIFRVEWYGDFGAKDLEGSRCGLFQEHLPAWTDEHDRGL
jgi:hypothetical protein